ncbi:MAG: SigF/SigG family RNA polymerase sporulation sigma factor [Lachnospiraceae bacterium]|jgi:RNA polymerase sporulation-specific sigma factor
MEHILALIERAHKGDKEARDILVEENMGLVWSIVRRFTNRGVELEDLFQIGSIGLMKAIDKFDTSYEVKFSTYAVPMITGEIKRFLRDDGMIKVSRSLKETAGKVYVVREELERKNGREPTLEEIAVCLQIPMEDVVMAVESGAQIESLQKTIYRGDGSDISLEDRLEEEQDAHEEALNRILLEQMLEQLEPKERTLIHMRFFQEKTQLEIAKFMDISQVQVSRMEKKILRKLAAQLR